MRTPLLLLTLLFACGPGGDDTTPGPGAGTTAGTGAPSTGTTGAQTGERAWANWSCEVGASNDTCVAWWPGDAEGADVEANIVCHGGDYCAYGHVGQEASCQGAPGSGCGICKQAFEDCYLPWLDSL